MLHRDGNESRKIMLDWDAKSLETASINLMQSVWYSAAHSTILLKCIILKLLPLPSPNRTHFIATFSFNTWYDLFYFKHFPQIAEAVAFITESINETPYSANRHHPQHRLQKLTLLIKFWFHQEKHSCTKRKLNWY